MNCDPRSASSVPPAVALDRSRKARLRLGRSVLPLFVAAAAMCVIVVWYRDSRHIEAARAEMNAYLAPLATYLAENGTLPLVYPHYPGQAVSDRAGVFTYVEQDVIRWARRADKPAIIGYGRSRGLIAVPNGHPVILYGSGELRVSWIPNRDLLSRLAEQRRSAAISQTLGFQ